MKKVPMLVSLAVVLAMAMTQLAVSWPLTGWEDPSALGFATKRGSSCPIQACYTVVQHLASW